MMRALLILSVATLRLWAQQDDDPYVYPSPNYPPPEVVWRRPASMQGFGCNHLSLSADGTFIAALTANYDLAIYTAEEGREVNLFPIGWPATTSHAFALSPDGKRLVSARSAPSGGSEQYFLNTYNVRSGRLRGTVPEYAWTLAFSPGGKHVAAGTAYGDITIWNVANGKLVSRLAEPGIYGIRCIAYSPDGTLLATAGTFYDEGVAIWDLAQQKLVRFLPGEPWKGVRSIAFSPDGTRLAVGTLGTDDFIPDIGVIGPGKAKMWRVEDWTLLWEYQSPGTIEAVAFNPDGDILLASDEWRYSSLRFLRAEDGVRLASLRSEYPARTLAFFPSGRTFTYIDDANLVVARTPSPFTP